MSPHGIFRVTENVLSTNGKPITKMEILCLSQMLNATPRKSHVQTKAKEYTELLERAL